VRRIEHQVAHEVVTEVDVRPRNVVVLGTRHHPEDVVGQAAPGQLRHAGHLARATPETLCRRRRAPASGQLFESCWGQ